jgi:GNAT superfamily N-acetyltransferase
MSPELKTHYWADPNARATFRKFVLEIHGLDFTAWETAGFWDNNYTPFSFFDGDRIVANVCVYLLDAVINHRQTRLAQISAVGTLPEYRRQGLNRELTEIALDREKDNHDGVFLFSDPDAVPFYERCGFTPIGENIETSPLTPAKARPGAIRLDPGNPRHLDRIHSRAKNRAPVSEKFGILSDKLLMFHALYGLRDCACEIPGLDCVVFCRRDNDTLNVYDIVAETIPRWEDLYPFIAEPGDRTVDFHFHTDRLGLKNVTARPLPGNYPFVKGAFPADNPVFPFTSRA